MPRQLPTRPRRRGGVPAVVLGAVLMCLLAGWAAGAAGTSASGASVRASPTSTTATKYYVVGAGSDERQEYLFDIAARTLGDGRRYLEIFRLNEGRLQPDGLRMTDPTVLQPGWILQLPADADGVGVHEGPLPVAEPTRPPQPSQAVEPNGIRLSDMARLLGAATLLVVLGLLARAFSRRRAHVRPARPRRTHKGLTRSADGAFAPAGPPPLRQTLILAELLFDAEVKHGADVVAIRLTGARSALHRPCAWVAAGSPRPPGRGLVAVGVRGNDVLLIDIFLTPDVVTLTGPSDGRARLLHSMATQLGHAGLAVTMVGEVGGDAPPVGARVVSSYSALGDGLGLKVGTEPGEPGRPEIIFGPATIREELPAHRAGRVVIVVGPTLRSRWSIDVRAEDVRRSAAIAEPDMSGHERLGRPPPSLARADTAAKYP